MFLKSCHSCPPTKEIIKHDTTIIKVETKVPVYIPKPVSVTNTEYLAMWVDTAAIVKDYLSKAAYIDTVRNKYGYVLIIDTIHENRISNRQVDFHLDIPQVTLTNDIKQHNQVYAGLVIGGSKTFASIGGELLLRNKKNQIYWVNGSYTTLGTTYYQFGTLRLIKF